LEFSRKFEYSIFIDIDIDIDVGIGFGFGFEFGFDFRFPYRILNIEYRVFDIWISNIRYSSTRLLEYAKFRIWPLWLNVELLLTNFTMQ